MTIDKENCCGCSACAAVCPKECIELVSDEEGFIYPKYNLDNCIHCHLCENVCPVSNLICETETKQYGYAVQNTDHKVLIESTSGGAFTAIAEQVINLGGVVYGASLDSNLMVRHVGVNRIDELRIFRNSKYSQSYIDPKIFREIKDELTSNRWVLFSGTACQTEGLVHYLNTSYENLILVDVLCHSVPSPLVLRRYIEYQQCKQGKRISSVRFRDKYYGYTYPTMNVIAEGEKSSYHCGAESDPYLRAFLSGICSRPSCYSCKFRKRYRVSDYTLWDCHNPGRYSKEMDNNCGATNLLIQSEKGRKLFDQIAGKFVSIEVDPDLLITDGAGSMRSLIPLNKNRRDFMKDAVELRGDKLFEKWFPIKQSNKIKHCMRVVLCKMGIYDFLKKMYVKATKKY